MVDEELFENPAPVDPVDDLESEGIEFGADKKVEEKSDFDLIEEGTYEVKLETFEILKSKKLNKNGQPTDYLKITFVIRKDVDQNFQNRKIWHTIFKKDGDRAFNFNEINKIIITQEGRADYKRRFTNLDEILQYLVGLHLRLDIAVEFNEFRGKEDNIIVEDSFKPSVWDTQDHTEVKDAEESPVKGTNLEAIEVTDDDLPF